MTNDVRYRSDDDAFQQAVREEVAGHLERRGGPTADRLTVVRIVGLMAWTVAGYVWLYSARSFPETVLGYLLASSGAMLLAISVAHDASHLSLFRRPALNSAFRHAWILVGTNYLLWDSKHDVHHRFANIVGLDHDISQTVLLRMNPVDEYRWFHRYQRYYVAAIYLLFGFFAVTYRDVMLYRHRPDPGGRRATHRLIATVVASKLVYFGLNLAVPIAILPIPVWQVVVAFLFGVTLVGLYTISTLVVPHINRHTVFKRPPSDGVVDTGWYRHCLEVTVDSSPRSRLMAWFTGGLNTHTIHHMFPGVCHTHYRDLTAVLERTADEHGVTYRSMPFPRLLADHFALLAELGHAPAPLERAPSSGGSLASPRPPVSRS